MDRMPLTPREQQLLATARLNPDSREGQGTFVIVMGCVALAVAAIGLWVDPRPGAWHQLSYSSVWLTFAVTLWSHLRFQSTAWSLIAKLDGSYADRAEQRPSLLGQ